jgi:oligopeptide/dipeptide ABC transporter ATP-binding protein
MTVAAATTGATTAATQLLEVINLSTSLVGPDGRVQAVDNVSFNLRSGEVLGIVGESGCGKTMTALSIMRLLPNRSATVSGHAFFQGLDLIALSQAEMRRMRGSEMAMIFQDPMTSLNPVIPIGTQIREVLQLHKRLDRRSAERRTLELLEMVEIPDARRRLYDYQHQFSGGMRQRVMIAMALSCDPKLLIADEATTALDVTIQAQILDLLRSLTSQLGTAIVLITHDLGVVTSMCDRVNVMYAGRIVESAPVTELFKSSRMPYTMGLLESRPQASATGREQPLPTIEGNPPSLSGRADRCRFMPRCRYGREVCGQREPSLSPRSSEHLARCWGTEPGGWIP